MIFSDFMKAIFALFDVFQEFLYTKRPKAWFAGGRRSEHSRLICLLPGESKEV